MKRKGLAIILLIAILASCLVFSAAADINSASHKVYLTNCNYTIVGWSGMSAPSESLSVEGSDGSYIVKRVAAKSYGGAGAAIVVSYANGESDGDGIDLSGCDYLVLHAYFSSAAAASISMQVELNSNTRTSDQAGEQERTYTFGALAGNDLKAGWNELKVPLSVLSNDQKANFQWFRMFNSGAFTLEEELIIAIDKMYGAKEGSDDVVVSDCNQAMKGWGGKAKAGITAERSYAYQTATGSLGTAGLNLYFNRAKAYSNEKDQYVNTTGMKFLVFDLYVSDVSAIEGKMFCLEISSGSTTEKAGADDHEWGISKDLVTLSDYTLQNGWNHIVLGLDREDVGYTNGTTDWTHVNWLRFFNNDTVEAGEGFTWGLDDVYFWDGINDLADGYDYEVITKSGVGDQYVEKCTTGKHDSGLFYFADATGELVLKFPVKNASRAGKAFFTTKTGSQLHLSVSADGENWVDVWNKTQNVTVGTRYFDIPESVDFKTTKTIYVKYADSTTNDGNGGRFYDINLYVPYEMRTIEDPHSVTITTMDTTTAIGGGWSVNRSLKNQGLASLSKTYTGKAGANGGILLSVQFANLPTKSYDTTNYEAVVLDMYVSDPSVIKDIKFQMEFCSGGNCDQEESAINDTFANYVLGGTFKAGWNTIVLPFSKMGGALNRTKLNYIRFYNLDAADFTNAPTTIAFDYLRLWDGQGSVYGAGKYASTKVQGFTVYTGATKDAKYDALHPDDTNANVNVDAFSKNELKYLVFTNAPSNGNDGNRGRYHDAATYSIWKFDTKGAETAKFIVTCWNQMKLSVSKDMENWTVVHDSGSTKESQEKRIFDLTQYIDGDVMYVKAEDSTPNDGYGFYVSPIGTYFVTTSIKEVDPEDTDDVEVSFTHWAEDGEYLDYAISDWWAGITGADPDRHPFYDRNIGVNKNFGGPQIVFAFPTNPNHKYAVANLRLNSNYMIEVSTDFVNWEVYTEKANTGDNLASKYFDFSDYLAGTDMLFIRVHSPMDMDGNGPQIHTNAPITFLSAFEVPEEIMWDDCSTDDNVYNKSVTHAFAYNEELNAISVEKTAGQTQVITRYGNDGQNPIDIRFMKWFEFDVYVSAPFPQGYNNQYILELTDAQGNIDKHEIQYADFVINEGWTHVVLPLPGNYIRSKSGITGEIDMSAITGFRFFSTSEESAAEYTLALKNLKFSRSMYVPNADWNNVTPNDSTWVKEAKGFTFDLGNANVVELDVYSADPSKFTAYGIRFEITSAGKCDEQEMEITVNDYIYKAGWNHIIVPLVDNTMKEGSFDRTAVNYVRVHAQLGSGNKFSFRNVKFSYNEDFAAVEDALASAVIKKGGVKDGAPAEFSLNLSGAKFVAMDLYIQDPAAFMAGGSFLAVEFASSGKCDVEEYEFNFGEAIDVTDLVPGWNHILVPLADAGVTAGPVNDAAINYMRIHVHSGADYSAGWVAVDNVEAVAGIPVACLESTDGETVAYTVVDGKLLSKEEIAQPEIICDYVKDPAVAAALINEFNIANGDKFEGYEVDYETIVIEFDDVDGYYVTTEDPMVIAMEQITIDGTGAVSVLTEVEGDYYFYSYTNDENGFVTDVDNFETKIFVVAAIVVGKEGQTAVQDFTADTTNFEEGTTVYVDVVDLANADEELVDAAEEIKEEFQADFEADLTYDELHDNNYDYSVVAVYDVYALKDFVEVQPTGKVKMSITAPSLLSSETAKLYHVHDDGTREEVEYTVNGKKWEFEMDGFSYLVVVKVTPEVKGNPYTGDMMVAYIALALVAVLGAGVTVLYVRKKRNDA